MCSRIRRVSQRGQRPPTLWTDILSKLRVSCDVQTTAAGIKLPGYGTLIASHFVHSYVRINNPVSQRWDLPARDNPYASKHINQLNSCRYEGGEENSQINAHRAPDCTMRAPVRRAALAFLTCLRADARSPPCKSRSRLVGPPPCLGAAGGSRTLENPQAACAEVKR